MAAEIISQEIRTRPEWIKVRFRNNGLFSRTSDILTTPRLNTICEEAKCPNLPECWSHGTATFLILGNICTRWCGYCSVRTGLPGMLDTEEPKKVADAVRRMNLNYVVITSVTRDDIHDGGASLYAETVRQIKETTDCMVELLVPDFRIRRGRDGKNGMNGKDAKNGGLNFDAIRTVVDAKPDIISHNIESVRKVFARVRPGGDYDLSLQLLKKIKEINRDMPTKSGIILGLGETTEEIKATMYDLRKSGVDFLTMGQYLQPSTKHVAIERHYHPEEFEELKKIAFRFGFRHVEAGPLIRSSYRADRLARHLHPPPLQ